MGQLESLTPWEYVYTVNRFWLAGLPQLIVTGCLTHHRHSSQISYKVFIAMNTTHEYNYYYAG